MAKGRTGAPLGHNMMLYTSVCCWFVGVEDLGNFPTAFQQLP